MEGVAKMNTSHTNRINPQLFSLWVAMASIVMLFGAFTSAYIVKQAAGNWLEFSMPYQFYVSTVAIVASSIALHISYKSYIEGREKAYKSLLIIAFILGTIFILFQYQGWRHLFEVGVDFKLNVAGSFFYLITGAHAAHVLGGIGALIVAMIHAFALPFEYKEIRKNRFQLVLHYWHFVDALWIYLLLFLIYIK